MKKILSVLLIAGMASFIGCGPSEEEKAAEAKRVQDSIASVETAMQEAAAAAEKATADSLAIVAAEKATADSLEAVTAASKKKPASKAKTPEQKKTEEAKKATRGRG